MIMCFSSATYSSPGSGAEQSEIEVYINRSMPNEWDKEREASCAEEEARKEVFVITGMWKERTCVV